MRRSLAIGCLFAITLNVWTPSGSAGNGYPEDPACRIGPDGTGVRMWVDAPGAHVCAVTFPVRAGIGGANVSLNVSGETLYRFGIFLDGTSIPRGVSLEMDNDGWCNCMTDGSIKGGTPARDVVYRLSLEHAPAKVTTTVYRCQTLDLHCIAVWGPHARTNNLPVEKVDQLRIQIWTTSGSPRSDYTWEPVSLRFTPLV